MVRILSSFVLLAGFATTAQADIWKWVDANGDTHFVDSDTPIYMWTDESGKVHYADTPRHEDAVTVDLVWHSTGELEDMAAQEDEDGFAYPGETVEDRHARQQAEAYYCQRAQEIYDSYVNAPQLYRTNEDGEREYLSRAEARAEIAEVAARRDELCNL